MEFMEMIDKKAVKKIFNRGGGRSHMLQVQEQAGGF